MMVEEWDYFVDESGIRERTEYSFNFIVDDFIFP